MLAACRRYIQWYIAYWSAIKSDCLWPLGFYPNKNGIDSMIWSRTLPAPNFLKIHFAVFSMLHTKRQEDEKSDGTWCNAPYWVIKPKKGKRTNPQPDTTYILHSGYMLRIESVSSCEGQMMDWFSPKHVATNVAPGGAVGWGTALQAARSRVRFPMVLLEFFIDIILPASLWPWGRLRL